MAYETYTTEALVCGSHMRGEHDATIRLYTKGAGMIYARAGGVRAGQSKLRYALQDFSYTKVSLVHGRIEWRIIGAVSIENFYYQSERREARVSQLASMRALRRLMQGGTAHPELFDMVIESMRSLATGLHTGIGEQLFLLRLLYQLGYVAPHSSLDSLVSSETLIEACSLYTKGGRIQKVVADIIDKALLSSHL